MVDDPDFHNQPAPLKLCANALKLIKEFEPNIEIVRILCNPALLQRHWDEISVVFGRDITPNAGTTLRKMIAEKLEAHLEQFEIISIAAMKELKLQQSLGEMKDEWADIDFKTIQWKNTDLFILADLDDINIVLDDHIVHTLNMRSSVFVKPVENEVKDWYKYLLFIQSATEKWFSVQNNWLQLIPVFECEPITLELLEEAAMFVTVDRNINEFLTRMNMIKNVMSILDDPLTSATLTEVSDLLDKIIYGINCFIDAKRLYFPRFYFLTNNEVLRVLSFSKCIKKLLPFVTKCFKNVHRIEIENGTVSKIFSTLGEQTKLTKSITIKEHTVWELFFELEKQIYQTIKEGVNRATKEQYFMPKLKLLEKWPQQVISIITKINWTNEVETCFNNRPSETLKNYELDLNQQLSEICNYFKLDKVSLLTKQVLVHLYIEKLYARNILTHLIKSRAQKANSFDWLIQFRYNWQEATLKIGFLQMKQTYQYEYMGNQCRLVQTENVQHCYRTLLAARQFQLFGCISSPLISSKTSAFQDLAQIYGTQYVAYNCNARLQHGTALRLIKGGVSSGAWICFDNFHNANLGLISVMAQYLSNVAAAIASKMDRVFVADNVIKLNSKCYFGITLTNSNIKLPGNLKVLFRHYTLIEPDLKIICESLLAAYGFQDSTKIATKLVTLFNYCNEIFINCNYNFEINRMKKIIVKSGLIKISEKNGGEFLNECTLIYNQLLKINSLQLNKSDLQCFKNILNSLFPENTEITEPENAITKAIKNACFEENIDDVEYENKLENLYYLLENYTEIIVTGEIYSGKTNSLKILKKVYSEIHEKQVDSTIINPKTVQLEKIFDKSNERLIEELNIICAQMCTDSEKPFTNRWIIFDGPIDCHLLDRLFSALENQNQFCIQCTENGNGMKIWNIMETVNMDNFTPSVISKCGIIYFKTIHWQVFIKMWIKNMDQLWRANRGDLIVNMFNWIIPPSFLFLKDYCQPVIFCSEMNLIQSMTTLLEIMLNNACNENMEDIKYCTSWIQATFYLIFVWLMSTLLEPDDQIKFDEFYRTLWKEENEFYPQPNNVDKIDFPLPPTDLLSIEYYYVYKIKGTWKIWADLIRSPKIEEIDLNKTLVPTVESLRLTYYLELHLKYKRKFIIIGNSGTGKTCYVNNLLQNKLPKRGYEQVTIPLTREMDCTEIKQLFQSHFPKIKSNQYGYKDRTLVCFVDDLNLCIKDKTTSPAVVEMIRQYFDYKFWYNDNPTKKVYLNNTFFVCSLGYIGNRLAKISKRFLHHFTLYNLPKICNNSLQKIFSCHLFHKMKENGFPTDIMSTVSNVIQATVEIFQIVQNKYKPTPNQPSYIFNLCDFIKVINGYGLIKKEIAVSKKIFPRLWIHETLRVFSDRLTNPTDKMLFKSDLLETMTKNFKESIDSLFDNSRELEMFDSFCFVQNEHNRYEEVLNWSDFEKTVQYHLEHYNARNKLQLQVIFQNYSLQHLARVCRVLALPNGCGLLIGNYGSGRKSLIRLAANMYDHELYTLKTKSKYSLKDWRDDIKHILLQVGGLGSKVVLIVEEHFLKDDRYLNDLNSLLMLGEIQNLYNTEELQEVLRTTCTAAQRGNRSRDVNVSEIMSFYVQRCRENLHVFVCLSLESATLVDKLRLYPALLKNCAVDYFEKWPMSMYNKIAEYYINTLKMNTELKERLPNVCCTFNTTICKLSEEICLRTNRVNFITSASYIDFLQGYQNLMNKKQKEIMFTREQYQVGLDKLLFATEQVVLLANELAMLKPQLLEMGERAAEMSKVIEHETLAVEKASELVREEEKLANVQAAAAQSLKSECEADLALAIPILEDAIAALNTLKPTDITLVKSMKNPPDTIKLVMAAVCVIKEIKPDRLPDATTGKKIIDYWGPSKRILGEMNFLQQLKEFDKDNIPPQIMQKIRKEYLPNKDFQPHIVAKASSAAEGLCKWVIAMDLYDKVAKEVAPKKAKLVIAETKYAKTLNILNEKRRTLSQLKERLETLNRQLAEANRDMKRVQDEVDNCTKKYQCAQKLVNSLEFEKSYWTETVATLQNAYDSLTGDILVSASIIAYMGQFAWKNREIILNKLKEHLIELNIQFSERFNFARLLKEKYNASNKSNEVINYAIRNIITDNKTIIQNTSRTCLLVDPQLQMFEWLKQKESNLAVLKVNDADLFDQLKSNVESGRPTLIRNIQLDINMLLLPFLKHRIYEADGCTRLHLNGLSINYNSNFRLYLTTTLPNPEYNQQVTHYLNIIYSPITKFSLTNQLLDILIAKENNELHTKQKTLQLQLAHYKIQLKNIRYNILKTLSESKSNILDDQLAIQILDDSKIQLNLKQAEQRKMNLELKDIENILKCYQPIAVHGAALYKCLISLHLLNYMYQYALSWYKHLFETTISKAPKSKNLNIRINNLIEYFTKTLYNNISRSLFAKDTLIFSFLLYLHTLSLKNKIDSKLLTLFAKNQFDFKGIDVSEQPDWIEPNIWNKICYLNSYREFSSIKNHFKENNDQWKMCIKSRSLSKLDNLLNIAPFTRLILIRILFPEKTLCYLKKVIADELGEHFVCPPLYNVEKTYQASFGSYVIVILTTENVNPMISLKTFSEKIGISKKFSIINFGIESQTNDAEQLIDSNKETEYWICIQNCHLAPNWMQQLETICENFRVDNTNCNFRLWLITEVDRNFSTYILQNSTKVTIDTQNGFKETLMANYHSDLLNNADFYNQCAGNDKIFHRALYSICYFDAVLKQRQLYMQIGWCSVVNFDNFDLNLSLKQLALYIDYFQNLPFDLITYLVTNCNYGGKVNNVWDRMCIQTIFNDIFNRNIIDNDLFSFFNNEIEYRVPRKLQYFNILKHIDQIPNVPPADIYYLNKNDFIRRNITELSQFVDQVCLIKSYYSKFTINFDQLKLVTEELIDRIPKLSEIQLVMQSHFDNDLFNILIYSELIYFRKLISSIQEDLTNLKLALEGSTIATPYLNEIIENLHFNFVPKTWRKLFINISETSLSQFFMTVKKNFEYFKDFPTVPHLPINFKLSAFFHPKKVFLTILLDYARRKSIHFENISLLFCFKNCPNHDYSIQGMYLIGAHWNHTEYCLEPKINSNLIYEQMPKFFIDVNSAECTFTEKEQLYYCPLLRANNSLNSEIRHSNFVWTIPLPSTKYSITTWKKRNVFLVCNQ